MSESKMEELLNDIENIEVNTQGLTTSTAVRLNTLKSTVDYLKDLYSQNKESFVAKYHSKLKQFNSSLNTSQKTFKQIHKMLEEDLKIFGKKAMNHCILVFTHFDEMPSDYSVRNLMETENKQLGNLIRKEASGRVMLIDNHAMSRYEIEKYKSNLISMIDQMQVQAFSNKVFGELERRRKREEKTEFVSLEKLGEKCLIDILSIKRHLKQKWTREDIDSDSQCMKKVQQELSEEMKILDKMPSEFENAIKVLKQESFGQVEKTSDPLEQSMQFTKKLDLIEPRTSASTKCESLDASETSVDGWCFPANAKVYAPGGKKLSMSDLCIGDKVLTVNSSRVLDYEEIVFLSHADHSAMSDHMVITTDSQQTI
ncbi:hypothetical protein KUTeg_015441, partial [Tegillarca granosa]